LIDPQEHCKCSAHKRSLRERHKGGGQLDELKEEEAQEKARKEEQPEEEGQRSKHCISAFKSSGK
jgi:hypothetical protein